MDDEVAESLPETFLGRQPILDSQQATIGYELLFRTTSSNEAHIGSETDATAATADVVCKAFAEIGLANALGSQRAFVNVDGRFLCDDAVELLPRQNVTLELGEAAISEEVLERARKLKAEGYEFCLSGITAADGPWHLAADIASWLKIAADTPEATLRALLAGKAKGRYGLIASRVETPEAYQRCRQLGFTHFQGYYFARPTIIEGRKLDPSLHGLVRLINLLQQDAELPALEAVFKVEPALTVNLLRLTNSVGVGLSVRITSIRHAVTVLGRRQLQRWLQLLLFSRQGMPIGHNPLMQLAALRGFFMERLVDHCPIGSRDARDMAFLTGMMSLLPAALQVSMTDILTQIAVAPEVRLALARHEGDIGRLLEVTNRYDDNDPAGTARALAQLGGCLDMQDLAQCLGEAIGRIQQLEIEAER